MLDKNYLVSKSNALITASYNLSLEEQKLILTLASMVQPNDEEFKEYEFKIKDFMNLLGVEDKSKYTEIKRMTKELMKKVFEIREGKDIVQLSWLSSARYKTGEGVVILKFDSSLKPYLLQLKELYTSYRLENVLSLKSKYSLRLYELLKCNEFKKSCVIELEELKAMVGATEKSYSVYQNVKNRIILKAQKELKEKTDINFEFEEIKTSRKVTSLKFTLIPSKVLSKSNQTLNNNNDDNVNNIIKMMIKHNITYDNALKIYEVANKDMEHIKMVYDYCKNKQVNNIVAYMIYMLRLEQFVNLDMKNSSKANQYDQRKNDVAELEKMLFNY